MSVYWICVMPLWTVVVWGRTTLTLSDVLANPAIVGVPTPLYPTQKLVEEAVPTNVKTQFNMMIAVFTLEPINIAFVAVFVLAPVKENATLPKECVRRVELVMESKGRRVVPVLVVSRVDKESLAKTDVPPITIAEQFPEIAISRRSHSTKPTFVAITGNAEAAEDC